MEQASTGECAGNRGDVAYDALLERLNERVAIRVEGRPLFTTDCADKLWAAYLDAFGPEGSPERQEHNCHSCRHFIERYGSLATIDPSTGGLASVVWLGEMTSPVYTKAFEALDRLVRRAKVTGVFVTSDRVLGTPETGVWRHLHAQLPEGNVMRPNKLKTCHQVAAEKSEDFKNVMRAIQRYSLRVIEVAQRLLESDALYRAEKVMGPVTWLRDVHAAVAGVAYKEGCNLLWLKVATAPAGFCHPTSSMAGTLLEDIADGMPFEDVAARFKAKMHPLAYQRPQAPPSEGNIDAAEKIFEKLGAARSLLRRFVRLDEVEALWKPKAAEQPAEGGGVFGHLRNKPQEAGGVLSAPAQTMTWVKFMAQVLPDAERIEICAPGHGYAVLTTAVHADAPPILQWDREEARNPVSWYYWIGTRQSPRTYGLLPAEWCEVSAVTLKPSMWGMQVLPQFGSGVMFIIEKARESIVNCTPLFPEQMRAEYREIRSVIEAWSKTGDIQGVEEPHVAGVMVQTGTPLFSPPPHLRVWKSGIASEYKLDRWE